jgi:hypothetical protein
VGPGSCRQRGSRSACHRGSRKSLFWCMPCVQLCRPMGVEVGGLLGLWPGPWAPASRGGCAVGRHGGDGRRRGTFPATRPCCCPAPLAGRCCRGRVGRPGPCSFSVPFTAGAPPTLHRLCQQWRRRCALFVAAAQHVLPAAGAAPRLRCCCHACSTPVLCTMPPIPLLCSSAPPLSILRLHFTSTTCPCVHLCATLSWPPA